MEKNTERRGRKTEEMEETKETRIKTEEDEAEVKGRNHQKRMTKNNSAETTNIVKMIKNAHIEMTKIVVEMMTKNVVEMTKKIM